MEAVCAEVARLTVAADAYYRAGAVRALLGGYVPVDHPDHPSRWCSGRQVELFAAEHELARATRELAAARLAVAQQ